MPRYHKPVFTRSGLKSVETQEGEYIERKVERIVHNNEPITDGSPEIFTPLKDGVIPAYNVRTDRWEIAAEAMDYVSRSHDAKREEKAKLGGSDKEDKLADGDTGKDVKDKSTQGSKGSDESAKKD